MNNFKQQKEERFTIKINKIKICIFCKCTSRHLIGTCFSEVAFRKK